VWGSKFMVEVSLVEVQGVGFRVGCSGPAGRQCNLWTLWPILQPTEDGTKLSGKDRPPPSSVRGPRITH
jgi:hypothetical protein